MLPGWEAEALAATTAIVSTDGAVELVEPVRVLGMALGSR
jgi:hypothetical protein